MNEAKEISIKLAKEDKLFYFVANAIIYRDSDQRCLILKRSEQEKVHPGKYAVPGGKLEWKDLPITNPTRINGDVFDFENALEDLLRRESVEEAGVEIHNDIYYINSIAYIRPDGIPVMMEKFAVKYKAGEIILEEGAFTDFAWVNKEEVKKYDCIEGIPEEIIKVIDMFSNQKN